MTSTALQSSGRSRVAAVGQRNLWRPAPTAAVPTLPRAWSIRILTLTDPLVSRADSDDDQNRLFLALHGHGGRIGPVIPKTMNYAVRRFRARANAAIDLWNQEHPEAQKPALPDFALRDLRGSVVEEVYRVSGGHIGRAQRAAGHLSPDTTERYVQSPATRAMRTRIIAQLQQQMVDLVTGCRPEGDAPLPDGTTLPPAPLSATFASIHSRGGRQSS